MPSMNPPRTLVLPLVMGLTLLCEPSLNARQIDAAADADRKPALTLNEIVGRMEQKNRERAEALRKFQGTRVYRMQYSGFFGNRNAEMTVKVAYTFPDDKQFTVVSTSGTKFVIDHVFKGLLEGEKEAANADNRRRTALTAENYNFTLAGSAAGQDPPQYVLNVIPKNDNKYLYRGRIWIDAKDFAVTRIEAEPAKSPSFWVKKSKVNHRYEKVGDFWLPAENRTESSIRPGGRALLSIEYEDYEITESAPSQNLDSARDGAADPVPHPLDFAAARGILTSPEK